MSSGRELTVIRREDAASTVPALINTLGEVERVAAACAKSGYYKDVRDASQAVVKMLAGREMGVGPIQALASMHIIEGKPSASASLLGALVKRSGRYDYRVTLRTDEECRLAWFERGERVGESSFSKADATRAGLWGKQNWNKYPRSMLFARALTDGIRTYAPDAAMGIVYTPEELSPDLTVNDSGDVIPQPSHQPAPQQEPFRPEPIARPDPPPVDTAKAMASLHAKATELAVDHATLHDFASEHWAVNSLTECSGQMLRDLYRALTQGQVVDWAMSREGCHDADMEEAI